jgi:hypothetical protein
VVVSSCAVTTTEIVVCPPSVNSISPDSSPLVTPTPPTSIVAPACPVVGVTFTEATLFAIDEVYDVVVPPNAGARVPALKAKPLNNAFDDLARSTFTV